MSRFKGDYYTFDDLLVHGRSNILDLSILKDSQGTALEMHSLTIPSLSVGFLSKNMTHWKLNNFVASVTLCAKQTLTKCSAGRK